jgi:hypothetical protein
MTITFDLWKIMLAKDNKLAYMLLIFGTPITIVMDIFYSIYLVETNYKNTLWISGQRSYLYHAFAQTFAPLGDISKNLVDTFKPFKYRISTELQRILQQPIIGFANVVSGIYRLISAPVIGLATTVYLLASLIFKPTNYQQIFSNIASTLKNTIYRTINGPARIIAGLAQIALTPFNWTLKPFIRGMITIESPLAKIENNAGIQQRLATVSLTTDREHRISTYYDISRKINKCKAQGQETAYKHQKEEQLFANIRIAEPNKQDPQSATKEEIEYYNLIKNPSKFFADRTIQKINTHKAKSEAPHPKARNGKLH